MTEPICFSSICFDNSPRQRQHHESTLETLAHTLEA